MGKGSIYVIVLLLGIALYGIPRAEEIAPAEAKSPNEGPARPPAGQSFLAALVTTVNIPVRSILCVADAGMGFVVMSASAGRGYAQAAEIVESGCAGPWFIGPRTIEEGRQKKEDDINKAFLTGR